MLSKQNEQIWRRLHVPVSALFELTPRCNLDCKMCYVHLTPEQMGDRRELSTEQWLRLTDEAVKAGLLFVTLTGGECMLHPGFWEIYEHLLARGVAVSINTNAWALTDEDLERFRQNCPSDFRVSLYGASEEGYERCTGRRAFGRVKGNVKKLRDAGFRVKLAIMLNRFTAEEISGMIRTAGALRVPFQYVSDLNEPNPDTGRHLEDFDLSNERLVELYQEIRRLEGGRLFQNEPIRETPGMLPDDPACKGMRCGAGVCSYVLHWDGRMSPCFRFCHDVPVLELGFQAAWEAVMQASAELQQPVECERCSLRPACSVCVFKRRDPNNPGHCSRRMCEMTILRCNSGVIRFPKAAETADELLEC